MNFDVVISKVERVSKFNLGFCNLIDIRYVYVKYLWLFYFYGWLSLFGCFFVWEINL